MITRLELKELRLRACANRAAAESVAAEMTRSDEFPIPLLVSIEDDRHVAILRAYGEEDPATPNVLDRDLGSYGVASTVVRGYRSRLAIPAAGRVNYFRLAVTESGINAPDQSPALGDSGGRWRKGANADGPEMIWVGIPDDSHGGLLVLVGHRDGAAFSPDRQTSGWPLPLSTDLGVRIYAGVRA